MPRLLRQKTKQIELDIQRELLRLWRTSMSKVHRNSCVVEIYTFFLCPCVHVSRLQKLDSGKVVGYLCLVLFIAVTMCAIISSVGVPSGYNLAVEWKATSVHFKIQKPLWKLFGCLKFLGKNCYFWCSAIATLQLSHRLTSLQIDWWLKNAV